MSSVVRAVPTASRIQWMPDEATKSCLLCGDQFGVFTARHHCRQCGGVFCSACSSKTSMDVLGYCGTPVRVCKACFNNQLSFLVVWHSFFSFHTKLLGDLNSAQTTYAKISRSSSRAIIRMSDGQVIAQWFKNASWQEQVLNFALFERRKNYVMSPALPGGQIMPVGAVSERREQSKRTSCLWYYRRRDGDDVEYSWCWEDADLTAAKEAAVGMFQAVILDYQRSTVLFVINHAWFTRQQTLVAEAQTLMESLSCEVCWHWNGDFHHVRCAGLGQTNQQLLDIHPEASCVVIDSKTGSLVREQGLITPSWRESLAKHAGQAALVADGITSVMLLAPPQQVRVFTDLYSANQSLRTTPTGAIFTSRDTPGGCRLIKLGSLASEVEAAQLLSALSCDDDVEVIQANGAAAQPQPPSVVPSSVAPNAVAPSMQPRSSLSLDCPICMLPYSQDPKRPVLCNQCGNTLCLECMRQMRACPYCRAEMQAERALTNVAIMQLLSQQHLHM